jgi:hypothetical protein
MVSFIRIKRVPPPGVLGFIDEVYGVLLTTGLLVGDVGFLADLACAKFGWGPPTLSRLYLVGGPSLDEPAPEAELAALLGTRLQSGWSLEHAGIECGSWVLAQMPPPSSQQGLVVEPLLMEGLKRDLLEELKRGIKEEAGLQSYHALNALSHASLDKVKGGALFSVLDGPAGVPVFCGFFISETIALTINHDKLFDRALPISVCAVSAAGEDLVFDVLSTDPALDLTILRLSSGGRMHSTFFSLPGYAELPAGLGIALVTMNIGNRSSAPKGSPPYSVHAACVTMVGDEIICYDGADTWGGHSGGALLIEEGCVVGMHLAIDDARPEPRGGNHARGSKRRSPATRLCEVEALVDDLSVGSSSHGKVCRALRLANPLVRAAIELAQAQGGGGRSSGGGNGSQGGGERWRGGVK